MVLHFLTLVRYVVYSGLDNPAIGITAILIGVCVQYELHRREGRRREEQIGYLIRMLRPLTRIDP